MLQAYATPQNCLACVGEVPCYARQQESEEAKPQSLLYM
jgi:hypothetical protein